MVEEIKEEQNGNYWRDEIAASKGNTRRLWRTFHDTLGEVSRDETVLGTLSALAFFATMRYIN